MKIIFLGMQRLLWAGPHLSLAYSLSCATSCHNHILPILPLLPIYHLHVYRGCFIFLYQATLPRLLPFHYFWYWVMTSFPMKIFLRRPVVHYWARRPDRHSSSFLLRSATWRSNSSTFSSRLRSSSAAFFSAWTCRRACSRASCSGRRTAISRAW